MGEAFIIAIQLLVLAGGLLVLALMFGLALHIGLAIDCRTRRLLEREDDRRRELEEERREELDALTAANLPKGLSPSHYKPSDRRVVQMLDDLAKECGRVAQTKNAISGVVEDDD